MSAGCSAPSTDDVCNRHAGLCPRTPAGTPRASIRSTAGACLTVNACCLANPKAGGGSSAASCSGRRGCMHCTHLLGILEERVQCELCVRRGSGGHGLPGGARSPHADQCRSRSSPLRAWLASECVLTLARGPRGALPIKSRERGGKRESLRRAPAACALHPLLLGAVRVHVCAHHLERKGSGCRPAHGISRRDRVGGARARRHRRRDQVVGEGEARP